MNEEANKEMFGKSLNEFFHKTSQNILPNEVNINRFEILSRNNLKESIQMMHSTGGFTRTLNNIPKYFRENKLLSPTRSSMIKSREPVYSDRSRNILLTKRKELKSHDAVVRFKF